MNSINKLIKYMESTSIPLSYVYCSFFSILILRAFGESYSQHHNNLNYPSSLYSWGFLHVNLFFIVVAIGLIGIMNYATRDKLETTIRFVLLGFAIILMTPTLDLIFSPLQGMDLMYIHPEAQINIWHTYFTLFGGGFGISPGLRTEAFCIVFGFYFYFLYKKLGWLASAFYTWLSYTFIFLMAESPVILKWFLTKVGVDYLFEDDLMIVYFLFLSVVLSALLYCVYSRPVFLLKRNKVYQIAIQLFFMIAGSVFMLYGYQKIPASPLWLLSVSVHVFFFLTSFLLLAMSNIGIGSASKYIDLNVRDILLIGLSLVLMAIVNSEVLFLFTLYILLNFIYLLPPYACKKMMGVSQVIQGGRAMILIAIGYMLMLPPSIYNLLSR